MSGWLDQDPQTGEDHTFKVLIENEEGEDELFYYGLSCERAEREVQNLRRTFRRAWMEPE